jgi:hypothetical protein
VDTTLAARFVERAQEPPAKPDTSTSNRAAPTIALHRFLLVGESDVHLFQRYLIQGARYLKAVGLLVFLKTVASVSVELAGLLAVVKAALLENRLRLLYLVSRGPKDWLPVRVHRLIAVRRPVSVLVDILILRCRRQREGHQQ